MRFTGLSDFLWFALMIGAFIAFNLLAQRKNRRAREERLKREAQQAQVPAGIPAPDTSWGRPPTEAAPPRPLDLAWGRVPSLEEASLERADLEELVTAARPRRSVEVPKPARRAQPEELARARAPLFRTREDLRRAVVLMTVLGPCRSAQPYDSSAAETVTARAQ